MARKWPAAGTPFRNLAHGNAKTRSFRGRNWAAKKARTFGACNKGRYMEYRASNSFVEEAGNYDQ